MSVARTLKPVRRGGKTGELHSWNSGSQAYTLHATSRNNVAIDKFERPLDIDGRVEPRNRAELCAPHRKGTVKGPEVEEDLNGQSTWLLESPVVSNSWRYVVATGRVHVNHTLLLISAAKLAIGLFGGKVAPPTLPCKMVSLIVDREDVLLGARLREER